jgi:SNW domain-containing protein 1
MFSTFSSACHVFVSYSLYSLVQVFIISLCRFQPDKEFAGTDRNVRRDGPVQFERDEEDPFGLDKFLTEAKRAGKRTADEPRGSR